MSKHREIDHATGVETTGHVWDGDLKELNKPLPRWWLLFSKLCATALLSMLQALAFVERLGATINVSRSGQLAMASGSCSASNGTSACGRPSSSP